MRCGEPRWCYALHHPELVLRGRVTARGACGQARESLHEISKKQSKMIRAIGREEEDAVAGARPAGGRQAERRTPSPSASAPPER